MSRRGVARGSGATVSAVPSAAEWERRPPQAGAICDEVLRRAEGTNGGRAGSVGLHFKGLALFPGPPRKRVVFLR